MKRPSTRQRLLAGALLIALAIAGIDHLVGRGQPAAAQASEAAPTSAPAAPADWHDVDDLVQRLTHNDYEPVGVELAQLPRDLFVSTPLANAAFAAADPPPGPEDAEPVPESVRAAEFTARHKLRGVLLGAEPLAAVDALLLPLDAELDGYRLAQIERDYVVFQHSDGEARVRLELEPRAKTP